MGAEQVLRDRGARGLDPDVDADARAEPQQVHRHAEQPRPAVDLLAGPGAHHRDQPRRLLLQLTDDVARERPRRRSGLRAAVDRPDEARRHRKVARPSPEHEPLRPAVGDGHQGRDAHHRGPPVSRTRRVAARERGGAATQRAVAAQARPLGAQRVAGGQHREVVGPPGGDHVARERPESEDLPVPGRGRGGERRIEVRLPARPQLRVHLDRRAVIEQHAVDAALELAEDRHLVGGPEAPKRRRAHGSTGPGRARPGPVAAPSRNPAAGPIISR